MKSNDVGMSKVTVLMPVYNVGPYLMDAIESVLSQTYKNFILLIMDDDSTDNTGEIVPSFDDGRIKYVQNEQNLGLADNLNKGLSLIHTEYVARMDGDDIAEPFWLEHEVAVLDAHPEIGVCSGGFQFFGTSNSVVRYPEAPQDVLANMLFGTSVIVPVFRHVLYSKYGLCYRTSAFPAEDYMFWAECARVTKIYNVQETVFHYRMHDSQISTSKRALQIQKTHEARSFMLEWLSDEFSVDDREYFLNDYVMPVMSQDEYKRQLDFADFVIQKNAKWCHFDNDALKRCLYGKVLGNTYSGLLKKCFSSGYSPKAYVKYLNSGLFGHLSLKTELKLLVKCCVFWKV